MEIFDWAFIAAGLILILLGLLQTEKEKHES